MDEIQKHLTGRVLPGRYKLNLRQPDVRYSGEYDVTVSAGEAAKVEVKVQAKSPAGDEL